MITAGPFQPNDSINSSLPSTERSFSHCLSRDLQAMLWPTARPAGCDQPRRSPQGFPAALVLTWHPEHSSVALVLTEVPGWETSPRQGLLQSRLWSKEMFGSAGFDKFPKLKFSKELNPNCKPVVTLRTENRWVKCSANRGCYIPTDSPGSFSYDSNMVG